MGGRARLQEGGVTAVRYVRKVPNDPGASALTNLTLGHGQGGLEASACKPDGGLRYGGRCFAAATALQGDRNAPRPRRVLTCVAAAVRRPHRVAALIVVLSRTRSVSVSVSESPAGLALRDHFDQRLFGVFPKNRLCRGMLVLPEHRSHYLRGRRRHALRNNLRKAASAGIRCEVDGRAGERRRRDRGHHPDPTAGPAAGG